MEEVESKNSRPNDYLCRLLPDAEDGTEFHDLWDTSEQLFLASSVLRTDRNWMSVSRAIKPFGELTRPTDWYTPKNCAFQYNKLLSEIEDDSKKKTVPRTERETSEVRLVKNLTEKRLNELSWLSKQTQSSAGTIKSYIDMIQNNEFDDDELDELINKMEEFDKTEIEYYSQYLGKRNKLIEAKKLNTGKIKGKVKTKVIEAKKKMPNYPDISDPRQSPLKLASIKKETIVEDVKPVPVKSETLTPLTLNALLDTKVTTASESPLLTSLLRSISSPQTPLSTVCSPSKESDTMDEFKSDLERSREASPRSSVPPSPRSATASSPMLNSLLKNSPSSTTPLQLSPVKEMSPKVSSSQQSFFIPSSLGTPQQVTVTTSALSPSHQFFQQDLDGKKVTIRTSPATSACLSAPTLSKLLEMPPSSPGKLPPLPVLDPPTTPLSTIATPTTPEPTAKLLIDTKQLVFQSPSKTTVEPNFIPSSNILLKSPASYSLADRKSFFGEDVKNVAVIERAEVPEKSTNVILEDLSDVFDQAFVEVEIKKENADEEDSTTKAILETIEATNTADILSPSSIKLEPVNPSHVETVEIADFLLNETLVFENVVHQTKVPSASSIVPTIQTISSVQELSSSKNLEAVEDDKGVSSKKFYKSRIPKKEETLEKPLSDADILSTPKKLTVPKTEIETSSLVVAASEVCASLDLDTTDLLEEKQEFKPTKSDSKSPVAKKPRLFDRTSTEKKELSEEEAPPTVGRPRGRKGKKGRGRGFQRTPAKLQKPEEVFEFSESSMEENSTGYKSKKTTCYAPRPKEETHSEDPKAKQEADDAPTTSSPTEKKFSTPTRSNKGKSPQAVPARKNLFTSDEERMSDLATSDDASNQLMSEDTTVKKEDIAKRASAAESPKKKTIAGKRVSVGKSAPGKKERKLSSLDMEDLSAGSRDSEDMSSAQENTEEKVVVPPISLDMEIETNDSQSNAAESDKHMEENDESLQGSATTDLSPPTTAEIKEDKDGSQFGNKDWFQGASPKSSEAVSQSSDAESDDESDNWDNQSVSTNKSASQYTGAHPRQKRKERETPEYKAWKKAINIVFREIACHKNANVFLQKVTNDVAPGYLNIVHKPMDLRQIKNNIENGVIRTTEEFHRDILIMFQNAIMYNSSDHDVHQMAVQMQEDVKEQIAAFVKTQSPGKDEMSEPVSLVRGTRKSQRGKQSVGRGKDDTEKE